jgi:predicted nucleic acid-binding protein
MNAVDTNVMLYRADKFEPVKQAKAKALIRSLPSLAKPTVLLWQAASELANQLRRWEAVGRLRFGEARRVLRAYRRMLPLAMPTPAVLDLALDLADRYSLSHWDSMLLGACQEAGVDTLFTEDMGSPTQYGTIRLENPFI